MRIITSYVKSVGVDDWTPESLIIASKINENHRKPPSYLMFESLSNIIVHLSSTCCYFFQVLFCSH